MLLWAFCVQLRENKLFHLRKKRGWHKLPRVVFRGCGPACFECWEEQGIFVCSVFLSRSAATQQIWGLWAAEASSGPMRECDKARYLCSLAPGSTDYQGCLEIKTECNYWARSRILDMFKYFHKVAQLALCFSFLCFFFPLFFFSAFVLKFYGNLTHCAPITENMRENEGHNEKMAGKITVLVILFIWIFIYLNTSVLKPQGPLYM